MAIDIDIKRAFYGRREILKNISFAPTDSSFTAVIGRNGSGKSTLISTISGLAQYEGRVTIEGEDIKLCDRKKLATRISLVPQELRRPHITVEELVSYGRRPFLKLGEGPRDIDRELISKAMSDADLYDIGDKYLDMISGGELRRAYFGMMLAQDTGVVLLDEATAFMDADFERRFIGMQRELAMTKTVITVMHNLSLALSSADNILLLDNGEQIFFGSPEELLSTDLVEKTFSVKRYSSDGKIFFA